jgi:DnaJ-class molecular chaperone
MTDHYQTLGVAKNATPEDIKQAYRRLASQHHPDRGGDTAKFQELQQAYSTLSDPQKRAVYDTPSGPSINPGNPGFDFDNIFSVFGARFAQQQQQRNHHARMTLWITLQDVAQGGRRPISVGTHQGTLTVEIEIPLGINDGDTVHYARIGPMGMDLVITFRIHANPKWQRNGLNLTVDYKLSIWDLILGGETVVQDIQGTQLRLTIPPRTQPMTVFRIRGRGLAQRSGPPGDLLVQVQATLPSDIPQNIIDAIAQTRNQ